MKTVSLAKSGTGNTSLERQMFHVVVKSMLYDALAKQILGADFNAWMYDRRRKWCWFQVLRFWYYVLHDDRTFVCILYMSWLNFSLIVRCICKALASLVKQYVCAYVWTLDTVLVFHYAGGTMCGDCQPNDVFLHTNVHVLSMLYFILYHYNYPHAVLERVCCLHNFICHI